MEIFLALTGLWFVIVAALTATDLFTGWGNPLANIRRVPTWRRVGLFVIAEGVTGAANFFLAWLLFWSPTFPKSNDWAAVAWVFVGLCLLALLCHMATFWGLNRLLHRGDSIYLTRKTG